MNGFKAPPAATQQPLESPLDADARAWVRLLSSGRARRADARRLERWCARSEAHAVAFRTAQGLWRQLGPAAQQAGAGDVELMAIRRAAAVRKSAVGSSEIKRPAQTSRRAFLGGAIAAS